ncbi:MAG: DUF1566 domain-containing protein [Rhodospirillales bacterium]|nr:DUF1566 domain-containing protein [Rhodospirillales bacterium]
MRQSVNIVAFVMLMVMWPHYSFADCPVVPNGTTILTPETRREGAIIYNTDHHIFQGCIGSQWVALNITSLNGFTIDACKKPPLCPNIGDVCDDGDAGTTNDPIFAGFMAYNDPSSEDKGKCKALYVTNKNQSTSSQWKTSYGTNDIATDSTEDGKINDSQIPTSTTFPAFKLCKDLSYGGYSDWYLPSQAEMRLLSQNRTAINAHAAGSFTSAYYWTSSEFDASYAWYQNFGSGGAYDISSPTKNLVSGVRCVRR